MINNVFRLKLKIQLILSSISLFFSLKNIVPLSLLLITNFNFLIVGAQTGANTSDISKARQQAVDSFFGSPNFNEEYAKQIIFKLAKSGDIKSRGWQAMFHKKGVLGYRQDIDNAKFWINLETYRGLHQYAMESDPEAMYLFANILTESLYPADANIIGSSDPVVLADSLFKASAQKDYLPAVYYQATKHNKVGNYERGIIAFMNCYQKGMGKAGVQILLTLQNCPMYVSQLETIKQLHVDSICKDLINRGSTDAELYQAKKYLESKDNLESNKNQGLSIIEKAIRQNNLSATLLLADYLLSTEDLTVENIQVINLLKKTEETGIDVNGVAKIKLAMLYLNSPQKEYRLEGITWLRKAALNNNVDACYILSQLLAKGSDIINADPVMARYWAYKGKSSVLRKLGDGQQGNRPLEQARMELAANYLSDAFWNYQPTYTKTTSYNSATGSYQEETTSSDFGSDMLIELLISAGISGVFDNLFTTKGEDESISSVNLVKSELAPDSTATVYTYFVTVNSAVTIPVEQGDIINTFANEAGIIYARGYMNYAVPTNGARDRLNFKNIYDKLRWSCLLLKFNKGDYMFAGITDHAFTAEKDGTCKIFLNDKSNGASGSFAFHVLVTRKNQ